MFLKLYALMEPFQMCKRCPLPEPGRIPPPAPGSGWPPRWQRGNPGLPVGP
uniref:Uncharacterized protein n=1 Tax=Kryptolebias marmoratus TaxID=37003 RepID=A0A3Q3A102_KRYMA